MSMDLYNTSPAARAVWDGADNIFRQYTASPFSKSSRTTLRRRQSISVVSKGKLSVNVTCICRTIPLIRDGGMKTLPLFADIGI